MDLEVFSFFFQALIASFAFIDISSSSHGKLFFRKAIKLNICAHLPVLSCAIVV